MTSAEKVMPIIRANARLHEYPFRAISSRMLLLLRAAGASNHREADSSGVERMVKVIEGALRVMGREMRDFDDVEFELSCELVTGALSSPTYLEASTARRQGFIGSFRKTVLAMSKLQPRLRISSPLFTNLTRATADDLERHRRAFEHLDLVSDEVWLWRGWYATSSSNKVTALPLYGIAQALGKSFTTEFHDGVCTYVGARAAAVAPLIKELAEFIAGYPATLPRELRSSLPDSLNAALLRDGSFADRFWRGFLVWHVEQAYAAGTRMSTICTKWNGQFVPFIEATLAPLGVISAPPSGMPKLDWKGVPGERTHIRTTSEGAEVRCKLLTDVPIQATDEQALKLLVTDIEEDLALVLRWSQSEVDATNMRVERRKKLAMAGIVRIVQPVGSNAPGYKSQTDPSNPHWLANAAATFTHYGFQVAVEEARINQLYEPSTIAARELGLPCSDVLLPYLNLLVAEHPSITPSFLETLELYDKHGNMEGFVNGDEGSMLRGFKRRRGPI